MKIKFITGLVPEKQEEEVRLKSKKVNPSSGTVFMNAIIKALLHYTTNIQLINLMLIGSYPKKYKEKYICEGTFDHLGLKDNVNLAFNNTAYYKLFSRYISLSAYLRKYKYDKEDIFLFFPIPGWLAAISNLKKKHPHLKTCVIFTDLPGYLQKDGNYNTNTLLNKIYFKIDYLLTKKNFKYIDKYILLTEQMKDVLPINNKPYLIMEGIYADNFEEQRILEAKNKNMLDEKKIVLYTGSTSIAYDILNLVQAFQLIENNNYELYICGSGDGDNEIKEICTKDERIKFLGLLARDEVIELQSKATVLVNPRKSHHNYTKYSFPSKTMEYLASGTPTIMNRLPGVPTEYFKYCYVPDDESVESLKNKIVEVCEMETKDLLSFGLRARSFIINNKSAQQQGKKIYDFLIK